MNSSDPNYIAKLLLKYKQELLSKEEIKEIEKLLSEDPELFELSESMNDSAQLFQNLSMMNNFDTEAALQKSKIISFSSNRFFKYYGWAAAGILVIFGLIYFMNESPKNEKLFQLVQNNKPSSEITLQLASGQEVVIDTLSITSIGDLILRNNQGELQITENANGKEENSFTDNNTLTVPYKRTYHFVLQDGSQVYLNAGSTLSIPTKFKSGERRVTLKGEGYFQVSADASRPFIVVTSNAEIKALGTKFNVQSYEEDSFIKTTLMEGKVAISIKNQEPFFLHPGQYGWIDKNTGQSYSKDVNDASAIAWVDGLFYFKDESFDHILHQIARWYDLDIEFTEPGLNTISFTGKIQMYDDVNDVLRKFEKSGGVSFQLNGRRLQVKKGKNS